MHRDVVLRPYRSADAAQVVDVINADAERTLGHQRAIVDGAGHVRLIRYVPPASRKVVAVNAHNEVVGYAYLATRGHAIVNEVGGAVHPRSWGQGIGTRLLAWAEQRAYALGDRAPIGVKTVLQSTVFEAEQTAIRLLTKQGFRRTRAWGHLRVLSR